MLNRPDKIEKNLLILLFSFFFQNVDIINDSDDAIARMISQMKDAAEVRVLIHSTLHFKYKYLYYHHVSPHVQAYIQPT